MFAIDDASEEGLSTGRLWLRPPRRADLIHLDAAIQETLPELIKWLPWARANHTRQETRLYLRGARLARARRRALEFVIEGTQANQILGIVSLHRIDWARRYAAMGYWVRRTAWGQGAATEAMAALVDHAFDDLLLHRLELHIAADNAASHRVAEKLGFQREGIARHAERIDGRYLDHVQYSLLRSDTCGPRGEQP